MSNSLTSACEILDQVEVAKGPKEKTRLLTEAGSNGIGWVIGILKSFFKYALDPFITFGVTVKPIEGQPVSEGNPDFDEGGAVSHFEDWVELLDQLSRREITGNEAKDHVRMLLDASPPIVAKWLARMLNKNPRCGLAEKGVLKIYPGLFKMFGCQLCEKWKDVKKLPTRTSAEPKFDGLRCLLFLDPSKPYSGGLSREGKPINNVGHVVRELMPVLAGNVVDGEIFDENWEKTQSAVTRDEDGNTNSRYMIFDVIPISEFNAEKSTQTLEERRKNLSVILPLGLQYVKWNQGEIVQDEADLERIMARYLEQGHEGVVLKDLDATYKFKRTKDWIKHKPWIDVDVPIIGFADGEGKWTGGLGAVIVEGGEEMIGRTEVGSGLTDEDHKYIWEHRQELMGTLVEVRYQNKTPDGKLRFPVFRRLRTDRKGGYEHV